jgi:hypothetical protein
MYFPLLQGEKNGLEEVFWRETMNIDARERKT